VVRPAGAAKWLHSLLKTDTADHGWTEEGLSLLTYNHCDDD
jgi:hypothetical protein